MAGLVFISYSRTDRAYVEKLAPYLIESDIAVWYDYRLVAGEVFDKEIEQQISSCSAFLVVLTPEAAASQWVMRELAYADEQGKPLIPILLKPVVKIPIRLVGVQFENVVGGLLPSAGFLARLARFTSLSGALPGAGSAVPRPETSNGGPPPASPILPPATSAPLGPLHPPPTAPHPLSARRAVVGKAARLPGVPEKTLFRRTVVPVLGTLPGALVFFGICFGLMSGVLDMGMTLSVVLGGVITLAICGPLTFIHLRD